MSESAEGKSRRDAVKKRARRPARGCLFFLLIVVLLAAGAGAALWYFKPDLFGKIKGEVAGKVGEVTGAQPKAEEPKRDFVMLYFASSDWSKLVSVKKQITPQADPEIIVRKIIELLTREGGSGTAAPLPASARLKNVYFGKDGIVTLDFASTMSELTSWGAEGELMAVYAIVNSISENIESAKKVRIIIDGKKAETLAGHVLIEEPLTPRRDLF